MPTAYITAPVETAPDLARTLVEERLAACVNIVECTSVYRWADDIQDDPEAILFAKTSAEAYPALVDRVKAIHPYDVLCIERFDEADELDSFREWREEAVSPK